MSKKNTFKQLVEAWQSYLNEFEGATLPSRITLPKGKDIRIDTINMPHLSDEEQEIVNTRRKRREKEKAVEKERQEAAVVKNRKLKQKGPDFFYNGDDRKMTTPQVYLLARGAGFEPNEALMMTSIASLESNLRPYIHSHPKLKDSDDSIGLWQLNMLYKGRNYYHKPKELNKKYYHDIKSGDELYDPKTNAKIAFRMFKDRNYQPWTTRNNAKKKLKSIYAELKKARDPKIKRDILKIKVPR